MMMTIRDRRRMWVPDIDAEDIPVAGKRCDESIKVGVFRFWVKICGWKCGSEVGDNFIYKKVNFCHTSHLRSITIV
uniref:Uncharacterized protein n=1 Tax=Helianthus annuus TaxID=4232 RepID=A0A251TJN0_HELAN